MTSINSFGQLNQGASIKLLRIIAMSVIVAVLLSDRRATVALVVDAIGNLHWVRIVIILIFVVTSMVLVDRLTVRIILPLLQTQLNQDFVLKGVLNDVPRGRQTLPSDHRRQT